MGIFHYWQKALYGFALYFSAGQCNFISRGKFKMVGNKNNTAVVCNQINMPDRWRNVLVRQGLERHPNEAAADIFVGGRRLTKEAHVPLTKIQPVQVGYSGKPTRRPKKINS